MSTNTLRTPSMPWNTPLSTTSIFTPGVFLAKSSSTMRSQWWPST